MACTLADSTFLFTGPQQRPIQGHRFAPLKSSGIYYFKWENLPPTRIRHQRRLTPTRRSTVVQAVAVPVAPSPSESAEYRKQLCESYGFKQIGEPLPENITMKDIVSTIPKKVFEIDDVKAWKSVFISVSSYALGLFMISKAPWFLLPLAWAWTRTAITGFFVIGHDCAHKSFSKNKLVEDIVGTLAFMPLIYPYEPWRFKHDQHHAKTNIISLRQNSPSLRCYELIGVCLPGYNDLLDGEALRVSSLANQIYVSNSLSLFKGCLKIQLGNLFRERSLIHLQFYGMQLYMAMAHFGLGCL